MKKFTVSKEKILLKNGQTLKIDISDLALLNVRIVNAKLYHTMPENSFQGTSPSSVSYELLDTTGKVIDGWENIEYIDVVENNSSINISDELQNALDKKGKFIQLNFSTAGVAQYFVENGVQVEYILLSEFQENSSSHEVNIGKAGNATIDLATGHLAINTTLLSSDSNVLPASIEAKYIQTKNEKIVDIGMPENWKLNMHQFLIKNENDNDFQFTYIDENGKEQYFEEKYFYLDDNNEKIYKSRNELKLDLDGNFIFKDKDETIKKILTETESSTGLKLASSIEDVDGHEYINYEPEELKNLKTTIKNLSKQRTEFANNLRACQEQLCTLTLNKFIANDNAIQTYTANYDSYEPDDDVVVGFSNSNALDKTTAEKEGVNAFNRIYKEKRDFVYFTNLLSTKIDQEYLKNYGENSDNKSMAETVSSLFYEASSNRVNYFVGTMQLNAEYGSKDRNNFALYPVYNDTNFYNLEQQIESCKRQILLLMESIDEIDKNISVYNHQKKEYETQVPVHYLYNDNNIIYGFGKTYTDTNDEKETNIYRLILIADAYDNFITIKYEDLTSNKIKTIIDASENIISFEYENGMLKSIIDARDRKIKISSEENLLTITHVDNTESYFHLQDKHITYVINANGMGVKFSYENNKVSCVDSLSGLEKVENGTLFFKENIDFLKQVGFDTLILKDKNIKFVYNNYMSTTITNGKNKSITYLFDKLGNVRTIYENNFEETDKQFYTNAIQFDYQDNKKSEKITELQYAENLLSDKNFSTAQPVTISGLYLGDIVCSNSTIPYSYNVATQMHEISAESKDKKDSVTITNFDVDSCHGTYILSGWAKADSAFVITDENEDNFPQYLKSRKFELRAEITYSDDNGIETNPVVFKKSFDWRNTEWQYCAVPVKIDKTKHIEKIECFIDFSNNTGSIVFSALELKEGDFERIVYDEKKRPIEKTTGHSKYLIQCKYDGDSPNPSEEVVTNAEGKQFSTIYEYTKQGKLLRTVDYNGIVKENVYNDKGQIIKSMTYHRDEPSSKLYEETVLDEKGSQIKDVNEFGEEINAINYLNGTGIVSSQKDTTGGETSYGYSKSDTLIEMTKTIDGIENTNTFGYNLDFLTSLKHNNFEINYNYNNEGKFDKISVGGKEYISKSYAENEETTILKTGEIIRKTFNDDGKVLEIYYTPAPSNEELAPVETLLAQNIYNTYGDLIDTKDCIKNTELKIYLDKFGNIERLTDVQHDKNITVENQYTDDHKNVECTVVSIGDEDFAYCYERENLPDSQLKSIILPNDKEQNIKYDALKRVSGVSLGNVTKNFSYLKSGDHTSNLISKIDFGVEGTNKDNLRYSYDEKGNITAIRENNNLVARYKYDGLSRITREDNKIFSKTTTFAYDAGGNITQRMEYDFTLTDNLDFEIGTEYSYLYPTNGWKDQLKEYNGQKFEYDALGNPTTYRDSTLVWSHGRQLDKFADISEYTYNVNGIRTSKKTDNFTTNFFLNGNKILRQQDASNVITFYYGVDGVTGFHLTNNVVDADYYYKKNSQNDIIGIYSTEGIEIAKYIYNAWGKCVAKYLQSDGTYTKIEDDYSYTDTSIINRFIAFKNPIRYRSYYYDFETNLYYLNSRYYDPEIGRFINADDISNLDKNSFNGLNLYAYCLNNPINLTDSKGTNWWGDLWNSIGNFFEKSWEIIVGTLLSFILVAVGIALTISTGGAGIHLGATMIGAGIGGFIGGLQSKLNGGSYWGGYLGGAISGGFTGLGASFGPIGGFIGGFFGNLVGTSITDAINGVDQGNSSYWFNLFGESALAGLVAMGSSYFSKFTDLLKLPGLRDLYAGFTILLEFAFSAVTDWFKNIIHQIADKGINFGF